MVYRARIRNTVFILFLLIVLGPGVIFPQQIGEKARQYTRWVEFNYLDWIIDALWLKAVNGSPQDFEPDEYNSQIFSYLELVSTVQRLDNQIAIQYGDPSIPDPKLSSSSLELILAAKQSQLDSLIPSVEAILQNQVRIILLEEDLDVMSIVLPPVLYHTANMPLSLILSPRDRIQVDANITLNPTLTVTQKVELEKAVENNIDNNVSALIEEVGGLGTYPSMIMLTTDLNWLVETIAHEWVHNYLAFQPLGMNYDTSADLRAMNETTASLAGKEIGIKVIERFYPERVPLAVPTPPTNPSDNANLPEFNFQKEMRITRVNVDLFLSMEQINEAEAYMEARRQIFWNNGYLIRRINQAYFAFHGAYNDLPGGGAAGSDPVGPAVVLLRKNSDNLGEFLKRIACMSSFNQLQKDLYNDND